MLKRLGFEAVADMPEEPTEFLQWFVDNDEPPTGSGPHGLDDFCQQVRTYWDARQAPNVHLFHYADLWANRDGEMRRVAAALDVMIDEDRWPGFVEAAGLGSMRARAADTAPDAHMGIWESPERFFRAAGTRGWGRCSVPRTSPISTSACRNWRAKRRLG